ncbi:hypothetical protein AMTR_s00022p00030220 [Amborella trichopoda]|uniref:Uncharacterized protein n=1 Tax=Amborella trichopoda TaxID=13333 RepID=W1PUA4_AMBTC|nr:hypothetical protein AMTR_s00022p00030220 [Amborella trichopoda]
MALARGLGYYDIRGVVESNCKEGHRGRMVRDWCTTMAPDLGMGRPRIERQLGRPFQVVSFAKVTTERDYPQKVSHSKQFD